MENDYRILKMRLQDEFHTNCPRYGFALARKKQFLVSSIIQKMKYRAVQSTGFACIM